MGHALRVTRRERPHRSRDARCVKGWGRSRLIRVWPRPSELPLHRL